MSRLYVVMGVSGCGKSTLGKELARALSAYFIDADDFHSEAAKRQMQSGIGLNDAQRRPWFDKIEQAVKAQLRQCDVVLACSALTKSYRQRIREMARKVRFIWPDVMPEQLAKRLIHRKPHFAGHSLLSSQLATFEPPNGEIDVLRVDGEQNSAILIEQLITTLEFNNAGS